MRRIWLAALAVALWAAPALAAVPNRSLSFVAIAGSDDPTAVETARRVAKHAERRLGLNPRKIHVVEQTPSKAAFVDLFRRGAPFQYVSQGDVVVVFVAGAQQTPGGLALADGAMAWDDVAKVGQHLRNGPGAGLGFFNGTVLVVVDRAKGARPKPKLPPDTAWLDLSAPRAPAVDPALPAPDIRDPLAIAGRGALAAINGTPKATITPGGVAWVGAIERLLASPAQPGHAEALRALAAEARDGTGVSPTLYKGPGYDPARFRLLIQSLRVALHPKMLANIETVQILEALRKELDRAVPRALQRFIKIERIDEEDPTADVRCAAVANRSSAYIECVEGRAPIFADQLDVTNPEEALAPIVRQVLRDYKALAATDWSARRRDLKPLDVVLLLDSSLSMAYHDPTRATDPQLPEAPAKREIVLVRLAATLSAHAESTGRPARLTTLLFGDEVNPLRLPGGESVTFKGARLDAGQLAAYAAVFRAGARPQPYTGIQAALTEAARRLAEGDPEAARHVILLTDGRESVVLQDPESAVRQAAAALHALGATLHTVGLTEGGDRLGGYLARMRAGGDVLKRYIQLLDMRFAPKKCRRATHWTEADARTCGAFYAAAIEKGGAYDPFLLDRIRRSNTPGVPTGVFLQPDSSATFQAQLQSLLTALTGGGVYLAADGQRAGQQAGHPIKDVWRFDLDLPGSARVVLYNRGGLRDLRWTFTHNGQPMAAAEGVSVVEESDAVTVVTLPAPARGTWIIERRGIAP